MMKTCKHCGVTADPRGQWWSLSNYYGLSGWFCPKCFDLVEHRTSWDAPNGRPINPEDYAAVLEKLSEGEIKERRHAHG